MSVNLLPLLTHFPPKTLSSLQRVHCPPASSFARKHLLLPGQLKGPFSFCGVFFLSASLYPWLSLCDVCASVLVSMLSLADFGVLLHLLSVTWWKEHGLWEDAHLGLHPNSATPEACDLGT